MLNKNIVSWAIKIGLFIVPILPLVVTKSLFFPFITGRNFIFRILIEILFVLWLWLMMTDSRYRPRMSGIVYAFTSFIIILFLATIFSISPFKSFWSSFERMEGFFGMWHYFLYFLILTSVFKNNVDWRNFFGISLVSSVLVSFYGIFQVLGKLDVHQGDDRLDATMGNATYLAIYLVFHIFIFAHFFFKTSNVKWRMLFAAAIFLELFVVYKTASRGAILGFIAGTFIFSLLSFLKSSGWTKKISGVILALAIAVPILFFFVKDTVFIRSSDVLVRFSNISLSETTTQSRFIIWSMAYEAWKDRPVLGWGPESFVYVFSKYYQPELWKQEPWFDRAHNVFFDWLVSTGILGLLAYLSIFGAATAILWKLYKRNILSVESAGLSMAALVAYFIHNIFVFDNFTSYIIFFAGLAYWHYLGSENKVIISVPAEKDHDKMEISKNLRWGVMVVMVPMLVFSVYSFNVKPMQAAKSIINSLMLITYSADGSRVRDLGEGIKSIKKGIGYNSFGTIEIREQLAQYAERISIDPLTSNEDKNKFIIFALEEMKKQVELFPYDLRAKAFLSTLHNTVGDPLSAVLIAKEGLLVSSNRQHFYFLLGEAYFKAGEENLAIQAMESAYNLAPEFPDAIHNYAVVLIFAGRSQEAESLLKKHFGSEVLGDTRYINAYAATSDFVKLSLVWEKLVAGEPNNIQYRVSLASAYIKIFEDQKAIKELEKAIELAPAFKTQGETFIKQIREGRIQR